MAKKQQSEPQGRSEWEWWMEQYAKAVPAGVAADKAHAEAAFKAWKTPLAAARTMKPATEGNAHA